LKKNFTIELNDFKLYNEDVKNIAVFRKNIEKKSFKLFRNFVIINKLKLKKISEKEFILVTPEYT
jgi:hypothetical protein